MRKLNVLWLALFAVFAFSMVAVSPAFAEEPVALWLFNNEDIEGTTQLSVDIEGLLLLTDLGVAKEGVHCEGIFDGWVGANGKDEITAVLTILGELLEGATAGQDLVECKADPEGPCDGTMEIDVETIGLPWATQLELVEELFDDLFSSPGTGRVGYMVTCLTILGQTLDECTTELALATIDNEPETLIGLFNEENSGICSLGGELMGDVVGEGLILHLEGGSLSVSEP